MFTIAKINKNTSSVTYLYENYRGVYMFNGGESNVQFNTEDAASNFIFYNYPLLERIMIDGDRLEIIETKGDEK